jgi:ubiquinone/menaquinone biosynthesis C-methylase UbiE
MSVTQRPAEDYVLGNSEQEQARLKLQGHYLEGWTETFFLLAGIEPGMSVLDLGCGMGDVSLLAAKLVGTAGSVTGIDRDPVVIKKARERVLEEKHGASIELIQTALLNFRAEESFDAVVGRYVLFYQPDPVAAIAHAARQVRPGGIVVFHEMDFVDRVRSLPGETLFERMYTLLIETFLRGGAHGDLGLHLTRLFLDAGLPWPEIKAEVPVGGAPSSFVYTWLTETLRSLLPRIEQFGLATADELKLDTLLARLDAEAVARQSQLIGPLQFGAWSRTAS